MPPRRSCILCDYVLKRESLTWYLLSASGDELLLTEMIFNGLFNDLTVEQATALLSCFVFQENVWTHNTAQHTHKETLEIPLNSQKQTDTSSSERRHKTDDSCFPQICRPPRSHSWARLPNETKTETWVWCVFVWCNEACCFNEAVRTLGPSFCLAVNQLRATKQKLTSTRTPTLDVFLPEYMFQGLEVLVPKHAVRR